MKRLTVAQVIGLHEALIAQTGGSPAVIRPELLESAVQAPYQSFDGVLLHPDTVAQAAYLGYGIICNHPFADGNKRTGAHAMLVTLALNGMDPAYTQQALAEMILSVAGGSADAEALLHWLRQLPARGNGADV